MPACSTSVSARIACSIARWLSSRHSPGFDDDVAADPQQPIEIDAGRRRRLDVEHVERVDQRDQLAARGRGRQHLQQEAGAARRSRADELGQLAARKPAAQPRV